MLLNSRDENHRCSFFIRDRLQLFFRKYTLSFSSNQSSSKKQILTRNFMLRTFCSTLLSAFLIACSEKTELVDSFHASLNGFEFKKNLYLLKESNMYLTGNAQYKLEVELVQAGIKIVSLTEYTTAKPTSLNYFYTIGGLHCVWLSLNAKCVEPSKLNVNFQLSPLDLSKIKAQIEKKLDGIVGGPNLNKVSVDSNGHGQIQVIITRLINGETLVFSVSAQTLDFGKTWINIKLLS